MQIHEAYRDDKQGNLIALAWEEIRRHLTNTKMSIYAEISAYPVPVAGCDQQFNYLLDQRAGIQRGLARLNKCIEAQNESVEALEAFIASSPFIDDEFKDLISLEYLPQTIPSP